MAGARRRVPTRARVPLDGPPRYRFRARATAPTPHSTTRRPRRSPIATHDVRAHDAVLRPRDDRARDGDEEDDDEDARCDRDATRRRGDDEGRDARCVDAMATARGRGGGDEFYGANGARARGRGGRASAREGWDGRRWVGGDPKPGLGENPDARDGASAAGGGIEGRASSDDDERLTLNGMFCFCRTNSRARRGFGLF